MFGPRSLGLAGPCSFATTAGVVGVVAGAADCPKLTNGASGIAVATIGAWVLPLDSTDGLIGAIEAVELVRALILELVGDVLPLVAAGAGAVVTVTTLGDALIEEAECAVVAAVCAVVAGVTTELPPLAATSAGIKRLALGLPRPWY